MSLKLRVISRLDIKGPNLVKGINFEGLRGYWIILQPDALDDGEDVIFNYDLDNLDDGSCVYAPTDHDCGLGRTINPYKAAAIPSGLETIQSTQQAFYFIDNVEKYPYVNVVQIPSQVGRGFWTPIPQNQMLWLQTPCHLAKEWQNVTRHQDHGVTSTPSLLKN